MEICFCNTQCVNILFLSSFVVDMFNVLCYCPVDFLQGIFIRKPKCHKLQTNFTFASTTRSNREGKKNVIRTKQEYGEIVKRLVELSDVNVKRSSKAYSTDF